MPMLEGYDVRDLHVGDVNGNGRRDVVVLAHRFAQSGMPDFMLYAYELLPHGDVDAILQVPLSGPINALQVGDVDGDGKDDVLFSSGSGISTLSDIGTPNQYVTTFSYGPGSAYYMALVEATGDTLPDVLTRRPDRGAYFWRGAGPRQFSLGPFMGSVVPPGGDMAVGDIDGDGKGDVAIPSAEGLDVILNSGIEGGSRVRYGGYPLIAAAIGDFNGDRLNDVATLMQQGSYSEIDVRLQTASHALGAPDIRVAAGNIHGMAAGDIDGDGRSDLAFVYGTSPMMMSVLLQRDGGRQSTGFTQTLSDTTTAESPVRVADMDGDGCVDVVVAGAARVDVFYASNCHASRAVKSRMPASPGRTRFSSIP